MQDSRVRGPLLQWWTSVIRQIRHDRRLVLVMSVGAIALALALGLGFLLAQGSHVIEVVGSADQDISDVSNEAADDDQLSRASESLHVDVQGAVNLSGVYELADGCRISDAIDAAGGLREDAQIEGLNRAQLLTDGQLIYVQYKGESQAAGHPGTQGSIPIAVGSGLVSINNATVEQLDELPGVGPSTAQAIVDDREQNGPFTSLEDLMRVSGIGEKKFEKLKGSISL